MSKYFANPGTASIQFALPPPPPQQKKNKNILIRSSNKRTDKPIRTAREWERHDPYRGHLDAVDSEIGLVIAGLRRVHDLLHGERQQSLRVPALPTKIDLEHPRKTSGDGCQIQRE
jgi:hypothetical protein